jgi:hypothetical protein
MPTGYTHSVQDGTITELPDFALSCARAFGALIMMRDDPADAPIPEAFEPSDYHTKALEECRAKVDSLSAMSEADIVSAAAAHHDAALRRWVERNEERAVTKRRYEKMLERVRAWTPPTDDHNGLKKFMVEQLEQSIDWDCKTYNDEPKALPPKEWHAKELAEAHRSIAHHAKEQAEEIERARNRSQWIADLRASLPSKIEAA